MDTLKGKKMHAAILISDLRGFSKLFNEVSLEEIVQILNIYFTEMIKIIMRNKGSVDKFMGDSILAVFSSNVNKVSCEQWAVNSAIEMEKRHNELNNARKQAGLFTLSMGIGIAAGEVLLGDIGSQKHMERTVIGDAVNLAAQLQAVAGDSIVTTNKVLSKIADLVEYKELNSIPIKGMEEPMEVIQILGYKK